jgi:GNAT superfamily N-acetyltransferase
MTLEITQGTAKDRDYLDDKIVEFNMKQVPFTQEEQFINIDYVIKNHDKVIGGITSVLYCWKCLYIDVLWVEDSYRHLGHGAKLLTQVEDQAKKLGASLAHLDTFDFQAKDFYLKQGYELFGVLDNCPPDHKRFFLKKVL